MARGDSPGAEGLKFKDVYKALTKSLSPRLNPLRRNLGEKLSIMSRPPSGLGVTELLMEIFWH